MNKPVAKNICKCNTKDHKDFHKTTLFVLRFARVAVRNTAGCKRVHTIFIKKGGISLLLPIFVSYQYSEL